MNDSRRRTKLAIIRQYTFALGALAYLATTSGCANQDAFRSAQRPESDTHTMLAESEAIQTESVQKPVTTTVRTSLVSTTTPTTPIAPTLFTLASNADLNQKIAAAPGPVLLDFYADWCGPCRSQGRILHEIEDAAAQTQTTIIKINIDEHRDLAEKLNVSSLPTLMMVKGGRVTERQTGVATKQRLVNWMQ